ncbi:MAG: hypothetical protein AAGD22_01475 [Verrucomicrobiota bacterium]
MIIYRQQVLEEDVELTGEFPIDVFQIDGEEIRAASPLRYHLQASLQENELLITGTISSSFHLRCVRCLDFFEKSIHIQALTLLIPFENEASIDLTERLREDILLDLPGYPRCEMADSPRECKPSGTILTEDDYHPSTNDSLTQEKEIWSALDDWKPTDRSNPNS